MQTEDTRCSSLIFECLGMRLIYIVHIQCVGEEGEVTERMGHGEVKTINIVQE